MPKRTKKQLRYPLSTITKSLYIFIAFVAAAIIVFDAGNLLTREAVVDRWTLLTVLFVCNTLAWLFGYQIKSYRTIITLLLGIVAIVFAGLMTYWERGMASTSTIFYVLPLLIIATLRNRHYLLATAALAAGTYAFTAVKYFNDFFNEGYRVQLWGNIALYSGTIMICAWLLMLILDIRKDAA